MIKEIFFAARMHRANQIYSRPFMCSVFQDLSEPDLREKRYSLRNMTAVFVVSLFWIAAEPGMSFSTSIERKESRSASIASG
jgi:hypothetical protein